MSKLFGPLRPATQKDVKARWSCGRPGERFRCYMCGHKFVVGDLWRAVYTNDTPGAGGNPLVCESCDSPDIKERWIERSEEARTKFWWIYRQ
jgi:hypothetical protein